MPATKTIIADMTIEERRRFDADRQKAYRLRKKADVQQGAAKPNEEITRELLADLAIMILATDAPGADLIMKGLADYFVKKEGWPIAIQIKAKRGKLRLKIIGKTRQNQ